MFKRINVIAGLAPATAATTSRALLKATLAVALVSSFSIALLLSSPGAAFGAPLRADQDTLTWAADAHSAVTPFVEPVTPEVFTVEPSVGPTGGGTSVKIKGTGFLKGSTVAIGAAATNVEVKSETEILAKTAPGSEGEDEVIVTHEGQSSTGGPSFTYEALPNVTSVAPSEGPTAGGTKVVIEGTAFLTGSSVTIGTKVASLTRVSETKLEATTATGTAGAHEVLVVDKRGASSGGPSFTYVAPPTITSITPSEGPAAGGKEVKIVGTGFSEAAHMEVEIGGEPATEVKAGKATEITAKTPKATAAGKAAVVVKDKFGSSSGGTAVNYTYFAAPTVTKVEPSTGTTAGGTVVKITGTGFEKGATVKIGAETTKVEVKKETEILATTAKTASAGEVPVEVTDIGGTGSSGHTEGFTYVTPPTVTTVTPNEGDTAGGEVVKIEGTGFEAHSTVTIGAPATSVTYVSATELEATTAKGAAGKDKVVVTTDGVPSTSATEFTYVAPPTITSITPNEGSTEGETVVKIKGTGFVKKGSTLTIGSPVAAFVVVSPTEIIAETAAHSAGKAKVVLTQNFGTADAPTEYTYLTPPAVVPADVGSAGSDAVTPASAASPPATSPTSTSARNALRLAVTVSGGLVHVHVTPTDSRTGRVFVSLRLVRGRQLLAALTHTVTITGSQSLTFTMRLPSAASRLATDLRASATYVGSPGVGSPAVSVALGHTTHKSR